MAALILIVDDSRMLRRRIGIALKQSGYRIAEAGDGQEAHRQSQLCITSLKEGMVVAQPIHNGNGILLLPSGAVLTERTIERLERWLGGNALIEVLKAA